MMCTNGANKRVPVVSVIMPAYNAERFLQAAIQSVQNQTYTDWELLVLDDGSQDGTCSTVEAFAAEDSRIRLVRNAQNMGVAKTRNRGFDLSRGDYVALLDSDDVWHPEKLERQLRVANETGADLVYCSYGIINEDNQKICEDFIVPDTTDFEHSLTKSVLSCSTALISRKVVDSYRFSTEYYHEDLLFWLQVLQDGYVARGDVNILASYRVFEGTRASNKLNCAMNRWRIYRNCLGMSVIKSMSLIMQYAILGLKKYKRVST